MVFYFRNLSYLTGFLIIKNSIFQMIMQGSQTLGKTKKSKTAQRHSAGNIDYDNLPGSQESDDIPSQTQHTFRSRSKTVGDGKFFNSKM